MATFEYSQLRETYTPDNTGGRFGFNFRDPSGPSQIAGSDPVEALNALGADGWELATQWTQIGDRRSITVYTLKREA